MNIAYIWHTKRSGKVQKWWGFLVFRKHHPKIFDSEKGNLDLPGRRFPRLKSAGVLRRQDRRWHSFLALEKVKVKNHAAKIEPWKTGCLRFMRIILLYIGSLLLWREVPCHGLPPNGRFFKLCFQIGEIIPLVFQCLGRIQIKPRSWILSPLNSSASSRYFYLTAITPLTVKVTY